MPRRSREYAYRPASGSALTQDHRALMPPRERLSEFSRSVNVRAVFDGQDSDQVALVVDAVDHAVVAAPGGRQPAVAGGGVVPGVVAAGGVGRAGGAELGGLAGWLGTGGAGRVEESRRCRRGL